MYVFRLHLRPSGSATKAETFQYCLDQGVLGVGWRTPSNVSGVSWDEFLEEAGPVHGRLNACRYIHRWVTPGCLVWTRDTQGIYYIARVVSGWEYLTTAESRVKDIDIANVFRVESERLMPDEVPGKVVASFRASMTIQEISDPTAIEYSKFLWNRKANAEIYELSPAIRDMPDIFSLLDAEEVEDIVFLFLQKKGWLVIPSSRKADTMAFEYSVVDTKTGEHAEVQVKTGGARLATDDYVGCRFKVILFQSNGLYTGSPQPNVECIARSEIEAFIESASRWLPQRYRTKLSMFKALGSADASRVPPTPHRP